MEFGNHTAEVLVEALPYIKKFYGTTIVIKYGGHAMVDKEMREKVISDIVLSTIGWKKKTINVVSLMGCVSLIVKCWRLRKWS